MTRYYPDLGSASHWLKKTFLANQKRYPDRMGKDKSSVRNFCARFSGVIWRGNQWGVAKCRLFSQASHFITPDNGKVIRLILAENTLQRKIKEAVEIKTSCPSLNLDGGPELGNHL